MNINDLLITLPQLYLNVRKPTKRSEILKILKLEHTTRNYKKLENLVNLGFLLVESPGVLKADRKKIKKFIQDNPICKNIIETGTSIYMD